MSRSKHLGPDQAPVDRRDDLDRTPGIGGSKGLFAAGAGDADLIDGDSTVEGDVDNDSGRGGGVNPKPGRRND